ncbi:hypothetical protein ACH5RR_021570 [Cinchona calisaya]|uniref:Uncharacterized protein n=1 Tax=Cinchona calisaya TaxID=153742 RepID=A0ABD2ZJH1_9GENT
MFKVNRDHKVIAIYSGKDANDKNDDVDVNGINNDPLAPVEVDEGAHHKRGIRGDDRSPDFANYVFDLLNYAEYADLIREDYEAYIANKGKGKMKEKEVVSDDKYLNATFNTSDDEESDEFLEFNFEREKETTKLVVGQLFFNVNVFREIVKQYSIINGFELSYKTQENGEATSTIDTASGTSVQIVVAASRITRSSVNNSAMGETLVFVVHMVEAVVQTSVLLGCIWLKWLMFWLTLVNCDMVILLFKHVI